MSEFKVKIEPDKYVGNLLSVTNNGYQWIGVSIQTDDDIEKIIEVLNNYLDDKQLAETSE